LKYQFW